MLTDQLHQLAQLKAQAAKLEAAIADQRLADLASLPADYGFPDLKSFIKALKQNASAKPKANAGKVKVAKPGKRKRAKVTDEIRAAVKAGLEAGRSGAVISQETGISTTSVNAIKKSLGLVKSRGALVAELAELAETAGLG